MNEIRRIGRVSKRAVRHLNRSVRSVARSIIKPDDPGTADFKTIFDPEYYQAQVGERIVDIPPHVHYWSVGWLKSYNPSPLFDVKWYVQQYPDVTMGEFDPLRDYVLAGWQVGRNPAPWFDTAWYLRQLDERGLPPQNPLVHYLTSGIADGFTVSEAHYEQLAQHRRTSTSFDGTLPPELAQLALGTGDLVNLGGDLLPIRALKTLGDSLVTVDVWDTLITRDRPADSSKVATAMRLARQLGTPAAGWDLYSQRLAHELATAEANEHGEYDARDILAHVVEANGADPKVADALFEAEIDDEIQSTTRREPIASIIADRIQRDEPTIVLSDFYIGADGMRRILEANCIPVANTDVLVSVDIGASKRLGTAYDYVTEHADTSGGYIHIGDNPWSDGEQAERHGATPALVDRDTTWPGPGELTPEWYETVPNRLLQDAEQLVPTFASAHQSTLPDRRARAAAAPIAIIGIALVARAIDAALERNLDSVHYLSREGAFLAQLHRVIADELVGADAPLPVHVQASRRATFGPSLGSLDADNLRLISRQYPRQSVGALLTSIGVDPSLLTAELDLLPYAADHVVDVESDAALHEFLNRPTVQSVTQSVLTDQRELVRQYLDHRGMGAGSVVVDVGWRGTIQDNLARLLGAPLHGVYLGLFPYLNPQSDLVTKEAVAFDGNRGEAFEFLDPPAIIESPMTPVLPTCIGYQRVDGRVEPILQPEPGRADTQIAALQETVIALAPALARRWRLLGTDPLRTREGLRQLVADVYDNPPGGIADIWFDSGHDDTFGAANVTPYAKPAPTSRLLADDVALLDSSEAASTRWPKGFVRWLPVSAIDAIRTARRGTPEQP